MKRKTKSKRPAGSLRRRVKARQLKLKDIVKAASKIGLEVSIGFEDRKMPRRFPDDPEPVRLLIEESERVNKLGNLWLKAETPNHVAADVAMRNGWAYALAAVWLRCKLKGELKPENKAP